MEIVVDLEASVRSGRPASVASMFTMVDMLEQRQCGGNPSHGSDFSVAYAIIHVSSVSCIPAEIIGLLIKSEV